MELKKIGEEGNKIEDDIGLNIDDCLNKLTQELGEFNDAVQKFRGRFSQVKHDNLDNVKDELGDVLFNLISICNRLGINPDDFPEFAENTLKKFNKRIPLYKDSIKKL